MGKRPKKPPLNDDDEDLGGEQLVMFEDDTPIGMLNGKLNIVEEDAPYDVPDDE